MSLETKPSERHTESPRDKPRVERVEHANLQRPGAQFHPSAGGWSRAESIMAWRSR